MRYRSRSNRTAFPLLFMAGALGIAGGSSILQAQEPAPPANGTAPADDKAGIATPQSKLRAQQLATRKAKAVYEIARATRELAEIAVEEYTSSDYPQDLAAVDGEIKFAESELKRAEDRAAWAKKMFEKGRLPNPTKVSEELSLKKAEFALEQARSKRLVLVKYTKAKTVKELQSAVAKAKAIELAKQAAWEREKARQTELERSISGPSNDPNPTRT